MIKDAFEDYVRHCEDDKENNFKATKIVGGYQADVKWGKILVGDILLVK
jgi:phospholipid-transporting ATPase